MSKEMLLGLPAFESGAYRQHETFYAEALRLAEEKLGGSVTVHLTNGQVEVCLETATRPTHVGDSYPAALWLCPPGWRCSGQADRDIQAVLTAGPEAYIESGTIRDGGRC